jgi:hypothetical protein
VETTNGSAKSTSCTGLRYEAEDAGAAADEGGPLSVAGATTSATSRMSGSAARRRLENTTMSFDDPRERSFPAAGGLTRGEKSTRRPLLAGGAECYRQETTLL